MVSLMCIDCVAEAEVLSSYTGQLGLKLITVNVYPVNTAPKLNVTSGSVSIDEMLVRKRVTTTLQVLFSARVGYKLYVIRIVAHWHVGSIRFHGHR